MEEVLAMVSGGNVITTCTNSVAEVYRLPGIGFVPLVDAPVAQVDFLTRASDKRQIVVALRQVAREIAGAGVALSS